MQFTFKQSTETETDVLIYRDNYLYAKYDTEERTLKVTNVSESWVSTNEILELIEALNKAHY